MSDKKKYIGTSNLTPLVALNRLKELFVKYSLNDSDSVYMQESLDLLSKELPELIENNKWWEAVEDNLTSTQWKKARRQLIKK